MCNDSCWNASIRYDRFAVDSYVFLSDNFNQLRNDYRFPQQFFEDVVTVTYNNKVPLIFIYITIFAVGWNMLRHAFTGYLVKPIAEKYKLPVSEHEKLAESSWKFYFYFATWLLAAYILIVKEKGEPLRCPDSMWDDWQLTNTLPIEYHVMYVVQLSFYLQSIYATIATDCWRKDSTVHLLHHVLTIFLVFFALSSRVHKAAAVTLFLHDICDVLLEGSKTALYFKIQDERKYPIFEVIANVGFMLFSIVWLCSRLYAFPLRLIWSCLTPYKRNIQVPLSFMVVVMLYLLLLMNFYWFTFILKLLYKVTIRSDELNDVREYKKKTELDDSNTTTTSDDSTNGNNQIESTNARHNNLRQRGQVMDCFICPVCSKNFKLGKYLRRHMAVHNESKVTCRYCDATFKFSTGRRSHEKSVHKVL